MGGWFFIFRLFNFILFLVHWISLFFFYILENTTILCLFVFWLHSDRPPGVFFRACFSSFNTHSSLLTSSFSVSLSYFILPIPMLELLGKHSCTSSTFHSHSEWYLLFSLCKSTENCKWSAIKQFYCAKCLFLFVLVALFGSVSLSCGSLYWFFNRIRY